MFSQMYEYVVPIVANSSGAATVYAGSRINGVVHAIKYEPGTLATGATLVVSGETTKVPILTKASAGTTDVWFYPRAIPNKTTDGAVFTDVACGLHVFEERIKIAVTGGDAAGAGTITFYVYE